MPPHPGTKEMRGMEWSKEDVYLSNNGTGPLIARILCIANGVATMERRNKRGKRWQRFELPVKYLTSKKCGWVISPSHRDTE